MTRKEELEERVERLASRFERVGEPQAKYEIVEALLQVEREVLKRTDKYLDEAEHIGDVRNWIYYQQEATN